VFFTPTIPQSCSTSEQKLLTLIPYITVIGITLNRGATLYLALFIYHFYRTSVANWYRITNYATLAAAQSAGYEAGSISQDPQFEDPTKNVFFLKVISPLSRTQGAYPFGFTTGSNASDAKWIVTATADNSGWYCADGTVGKNGTTGFLELISGSVGTVVSPVYDLASVQAIRQINLASDQTWPTSMIDTTKTDVKPNYQTVEIRGSTTSFNQNDETIPWTEVKIEQRIGPIVARFVQLRLTFRSDDVGA